MAGETLSATQGSETQFLREANIILEANYLIALGAAGIEALQGESMGTVVALGLAVVAKLFERATSGPRKTT